MSKDNKLGLVAYVDGGSRPSRGIGGYGVHGYVFETTPLDKPPKKRSVPTSVGYLDVPDLVFCAKRVKDVPFTWKDAVRGDVAAVKVVEYHEYWGRLIPETTNNLAEIAAAQKAMELILTLNPSVATVLFDSEYVRLALVSRAKNWAASGWVKPDGTPYANVDEIKLLYNTYLTVLNKGIEVALLHVDGHSNEEGNERADVLATRGIYSGFAKMAGLDKYTDELGDISKITPAKEWGKNEFTLNRLIAYPRLYSLTSSRPAVGTYYLGTTGPDIAEGKRVSDRGLAVVKLKEPLPLLDKIWDYRDAIAKDDLPKVNLTWVQHALSDEQIETDATYLHRNPNNYVVDIKGNVVSEDCNPPHLSFRLANQFENLEYILDKTINAENPLNVVDVTDVFYEQVTTGKKIVNTLRSKITQSLKAIALDANVMTDNVVTVFPTQYTFGLTIPNRNTLSALAEQNPKVYTVTHACSASCYEYYLVITTDTGDSIWGGSPANLKLIMDASIIIKKAKGKAKKG